MGRRTRNVARADTFVSVDPGARCLHDASVLAQAAPEARGNRRRLETVTRSSHRPGAIRFLGFFAGVALCLLPIVPVSGEPASAELSPSRAAAAKPSFILDSIAGERIDLAAHADRVVLVHFFATWCEPCREELAGLQRMADRLRGQRLAIIAVDAGEPDQRVRRFFAGHPATFPILLDRDGAVTRAWQVSTLPTTVVLDRTLTPRLVAEGDVDWDHADADRMLAALATDVRHRTDMPSSPRRDP